jgi:transposase-like protein
METCDACSGPLSEDETDICDGCRWSITEIDAEIEAGPDHPCPACCGEGIHLGALGTFQHYRCRRCGMTFHETPETN